MKALTCEMCGSTNLLKQDGVFVCQSCGTKYSVEEAKKMMVEGTVDVKGTVKVDTSDELKNLYEVARRAKEQDNSDNARKYYDMILIKDPSSWEANFYSVYFKSKGCKIKDILIAAREIKNCVLSVIPLVKENVGDSEQEQVLSKIVYETKELVFMLINASISHYQQFSSNVPTVQGMANNVFECCQVFFNMGDCIESTFGVEKYKDLIIHSWQCGVDNLNGENPTKMFWVVSCKDQMRTWVEKYGNKISALDQSYKTPQANSGCYVATAVYGSYDCPEVWTLRRFRDNTLAETWYGRAFIHTYYAISPTLVKWFGHTEWFKKMWKEPLDSLVHKLQSQGVENTPYNDRIW